MSDTSATIRERPAEAAHHVVHVIADDAQAIAAAHAQKPDVGEHKGTATCPRCRRLVRDMATGIVGEVAEISVRCGCGEHFTVDATAKQIDS